MLSWVENNLENNNNLTGLDNTINFTIKLLFYEHEKEEDKKFGPEGITALKIENLEKDEDEDILTKIKTRINEEIENSSDLTIITNFVQIMVIYEVIHTNKKED